MSELVLGVKQAGELQDAFRRDPRWTPELVKQLSEGDHLSHVADLLLGRALIQPIGASSSFPLTHPFVHNMTKKGWLLVKDVGFQPPLTSVSYDLVPFIDEGEVVITPGEFAWRASRKAGVNLGQMHAEWFLEHQDQILVGSREHNLIFPGTVWRRPSGGRGVPCISFHHHKWVLGFCWTAPDFNARGRLVRPRE